MDTLDKYGEMTVVLTNEDNDGIRFSEWSEQLADLWPTTTGELYRESVREYGRCTSKVYVDRDDGAPEHVGWFFVKREQYDGSSETYLRGAWVTLKKDRHCNKCGRTVAA